MPKTNCSSRTWSCIRRIKIDSWLTYCLVKLRPYLAINAPIGSKMRNPVPQRIACVLARLSTGLNGIDIVNVKGKIGIEKKI